MSCGRIAQSEAFCPSADFKLSQPHLDYLESVRDKVLISATKHVADGKEVLGFVWLIEAADAAEAAALCKADPFWQEGLRMAQGYEGNVLLPDEITTMKLA